MRIGISIELQEGVDWGDWMATVELAEQLELDSLWVSDHIRSIDGRFAGISLDPFVALAAASSSTRNVQLGTLVSPTTFRTPIALARLGMSIAKASHNRFVLGLGAGWFAPEHTEYGIRFPIARERLDSLEETLRLLPQYVGGINPLPLLVGGVGERRTLRLVAEYADWWNAPGLTVEQYWHKRRVLEGWCRTVGRDVESIQTSVVFTQVISNSADQLEVRLNDLLSHTPPEYRPRSGSSAPEWLVGTPRDVAHQLMPYADAGLDLAILQWRGVPGAGEIEAAAEVDRLLRRGW